MTVIRNIIAALSMYSKLPMPFIKLKDTDMKYMIAFLPLVGVIIGLLEWGVLVLENKASLPLCVQAFLWTAVPIIVSGGFHLDGFMDVMDALKSYKSSAEKLMILKDPHIGAFSVISLCLYGMIYLASVASILNQPKVGVIPIIMSGFFFVRAIGAFLSLSLVHAKSNGMLSNETKQSNRITFAMILFQIVLGICYAGYCNLILCIFIVAILALYTLYYKKKMYREFGGITGDTIGFYIVKGEIIVAVCAAVYVLLI